MNAPYLRPVSNKEEFVKPKTLSRKPKRQDIPVGHEAFLKALETSGSEIRVDFLDGEPSAEGFIRHSDKFTISLRVTTAPDTTEDRVIFKHAMRQFVPLTPAPARV